MSVTEVRSEPELMSPGWMTRALSAGGVADGATVTDVGFVGYIGTGQTGRNARLALEWDDPTGRPATVVAKIPSSDPSARASAFSTGNYVKEWMFYDRVASTVDITTPRCHVALYDESVPDFVLVMEDVAGSEQGDQLDGLSSDRIATAIGELVGLHAPHFGSPTLERLVDTGVSATTPDEVGELVQMLYGATLPGFLDRLGDRLDDDVAKLARDFAPLAGAWTSGTDTPPTLVHLDYRADNLLFGVAEDAPPLVVVDWQTLSAGLGASDLAYLVSGSYPDAARRGVEERDLVEEYRSRMASAGVELSADAMWRDYRVGSLWGMIITVVATVAAARTERGDDMLTAMAQRHGRQALDLDALSLVG
ncbi:phosphotransferase family protein [Ilumatobacter sp.]|uniref:phosphotransferase family protein n=1 Tax=Ilumatobacter sp. TaxID=1967498 RepID=UPI003B52C834